MDEKLPIRLCIADGESLSGYIMRSARVMEVDCVDLLKYIISNYNIYYTSKDKKSSVRYLKISANIDVFPFWILRENGICFLFNKSKEELESATFKNIFDILNMKINIDPYKMSINRALINNGRRFCPLCLKENGIYKLVWQIKEIDVCDVHKIKLVNHCGVCNSKQRYFSSALGNYRCDTCNSLLWKNIGRKTTTVDKLNTQTVAYNNWNFLLKYKDKLVKLISHYNFDQSLAITMLYVAQNQENIFCSENIKVLHKKSVESIIRFIKNINSGMKISLNSIRKITSNNNVLLSSLANIEVPTSYVKSLINKKEILELKCLSPWCSFFSSCDKVNMLEICDSRGSGVITKFVCTECYMRFGYNSKKQMFEPLNKPLFDNIPKAKELLSKNKTQKEIIYTLKISRHLFIKILTYLLINKLYNNYMPKNKQIIIPLDITEKFEILSKKKCLSGRGAKKNFGWSDFQFYYYYWLPEIQNAIIYKKKDCGLRNIKPDRLEDKDWKKELLIALYYFLENNIDISYENINKYYQISNYTLKKYQLIDIVNISITIQKSKRKIQYYIETIKKITNYLDNSKYVKSSLKEFFEEEKINEYYIEKYAQDLKKYMAKMVRLHNSKIKEQELEYYKKEIRRIYLKSIENGELESIRSISLKLALKLGKEKRLICRNYELNTFTKKLLEHGIDTESDS